MININIFLLCGRILLFLLVADAISAFYLSAIFKTNSLDFNYFVALILVVNTFVLCLFSIFIFRYTYRVNFKISKEKISLINAVFYLKNGIDLKCGFKSIDAVFHAKFSPVELEDGNIIKIFAQDISSVFIYGAPKIDELIENLGPKEGPKTLILKIPSKKSRFARIEIFKKACICRNQSNFVTFVSNKEKTNSKIVFVRPEKIEEIAPLGDQLQF